MKLRKAQVAYVETLNDAIKEFSSEYSLSFVPKYSVGWWVNGEFIIKDSSDNTIVVYETSIPNNFKEVGGTHYDTSLIVKLIKLIIYGKLPIKHLKSVF